MNDLDLETPYTSLAALRADHRHLQKRYRDDSSGQFDHIESFLRRGRATGTILDDEHAQAAAQSLLDFWATTLYRSGRPVPESTLMSFDPALAPVLDDGVVPYVGLDAFAEQKKSLFFGRSRAIESLVTRLRNENLVAVIGPSGSGKSSLVLAGLIPALKAGAVAGSGTWRYLGRMVPGPDALGSLIRLLGRHTGTVLKVSSELARIQQDPGALVALVEQVFPSQPTVLVIDQFEELSTMCENSVSRAAFENALAHLVTRGTVRHIVILTMRSDFIGAVARQPALQQILETALEHVAPLSAAELREAIERPAQEIGLKFEDGVVEALVHDILGEPAALPLLQFTLLKLWEGREHNRVTMEAYRALGGGRLALTRVADSFMGRLIPQDRVMADRIFLRLVRPGIGQDNVSNRVRRSSLYTLGPEEHVSRVLDKLIAERLIRATGDTDADSEVEVAHEALVRNWLHLVKLLDGEREQQKTRIRLEAKAAEWVRLGRGEAGLLKSVALLEAEEWVAGPEANAQATEQLRALVTASRQAADQAERRQRTTKRRLVALTAWAFVFAGFALWGMLSAQQSGTRASEAAARETKAAEDLLRFTKEQTQTAEEGRLKAEKLAEEERRQKLQIGQQAQQLQLKDRQLQQRQRLLEAEKESALIKGRLYDAGELTISAGTIVADDPEAATLLALQGALLLALNHQQVPSNILASLYQTIHANRLRGTIPTAHGEIALAFSPDSRTFVTGGGEQPARIWDTTSHKLLSTLPPGRSTAAAFSWDNGQLAIAGDALRIFAPDTGKPIVTLEPSAANVTRLAFSPDGRYLAGVGSGKAAHLWTLNQSGSSRHLVLEDLTRASDENAAAGPYSLQALSFSSTGAFLATAGSDQLIRIWATESGELLNTLRGHQRAINAVTFLSDGRRLVAGDDGGVVKMWRSLPLPIMEAGSPRRTGALATTAPAEIASIQLSPAPITSLGTMPDGLRLMAVTGPPPGFMAFAGPTVTALDVTATGLSIGGTFTLPAGEASEFLISPNATLLATAGLDARTQIWSTDRGSGIVLGTRLDSIARLNASTDGTFQTISSNRVVRSWDLQRPGREMIDAVAIPGGASAASRLDPALPVFSLDGRHAAVPCAGQDSCSGIAVYELATKRLEQTIDLTGASALALNRDGSVVALATRAVLTIASVSSGEPLDTLPLADVTSIAFSPDNTRLAVSTADTAVHLLAWDGRRVTPTTPVRAPARPTNVVFNRNGTALAVIAADRTITVWTLPGPGLGAPDKTATLSGHTSTVRTAAFSEDGRSLVSGGDDRTARVWNLWSSPLPNLLLTINVGPRSVSGVAFTRDQTGVVVSADDGTLRWFPGADTDLLPWALTRLTRGFKDDECRVESCTAMAGAIEDVVEGNRLAALGEEGAAAAKYESARKRLPGLPLQSQADAQRLASETRALALRQQTRGQLVQLDTLARANRMVEARALLGDLPDPMRVGIEIEQIATNSRRELATSLRALAQSNLRSQKVQEARRLLMQAQAADPSQVTDIDNELAKLNHLSDQQRATFLLESGSIIEAVTVLKTLRSAGVTDTPFDNTAQLANELCWHGSLRSPELAREPEVRKACETAVTLTSGKNSNFRDSRGLSRARNGDYEGAIEDFMTFVVDPTNPSGERSNRQKWIERLKNNANPFTADVLESLR